MGASVTRKDVDLDMNRTPGRFILFLFSLSFCILLIPSTNAITAVIRRLVRSVGESYLKLFHQFLSHLDEMLHMISDSI